MVATRLPALASFNEYPSHLESTWQVDTVEQPAHVTVGKLIEFALQQKASDLFLSATKEHIRISMRRLGFVEEIGQLQREFGIRCMAFLRTMSEIKLEERRRPQDGRWKFPTASGRQVDLRLNTMPTLYGESIAVRILDPESQVRDLSTLGLVGPQSELLSRVLQSPSGLILVTGPTGSGKTTTLYACLQHLKDGQRKIHTLEDPIEYAIDGLYQTQVSECEGADFYEMLRAVLRQNPDVIMIGEIRDRITVETAIRAANSGQLVFSTLHASTAVAAIQSMISFGAQPEFLATSLAAVISQRLVRVLSRNHSVSVSVETPSIFDDVALWLSENEGRLVCIPRPKSEQPFRDRRGIFEILPVTAVLGDMIANRKTAHELAAQAEAEGMFDFRRAALLQLAKGVTSLEEIRRVLPVPLKL